MTQEQGAGDGLEAQRAREALEEVARRVADLADAMRVRNLANAIGEQPAVVVSANGGYRGLLQQLGAGVHASGSVGQVTGADDGVGSVVDDRFKT